MTGAARVAAFAVALVLVLLAAAAVGRAVGPLERDVERAEHAEDEVEMAAMAAPAGLASSARGLRLVADATTFDAGAATTLNFTIERGSRPLRSFDVEHERRLHLIVVRRDFGAFFHVHPAQRPDGSWSTTLRFPAAGAYRAFADFSTGGRKETLGIDLFAYGAPATRPEPAPERWTYTGGYRVVLLPARRVAGREEPLRFVVMRGRRNVRVEPYLGARGHLVVLREGDLAYLHNHADENALAFDTTFPSAGRYRVFLQFKVAGSVHTAAFGVEVER